MTDLADAPLQPRSLWRWGPPLLLLPAIAWWVAYSGGAGLWPSVFAITLAWLPFAWLAAGQLRAMGQPMWPALLLPLIVWIMLGLFLALSSLGWINGDAPDGPLAISLVLIFLLGPPISIVASIVLLFIVLLLCAREPGTPPNEVQP